MSYDHKTKTINLSNETPNSDFLISSGLFSINVLRDLANESPVQQLKDDWKIVEDWLGCKGRQFNESDNNKIMDAWKFYYSVGLAPSIALQPSFDQFSKDNNLDKTTLLRPPTNVMDVFDRTLATDEEIRIKRAIDYAKEKNRLNEILRKAPVNKNTAKKFSHLSKNTRIFIVVSIAWMLWVTARTSDYFELFGVDFERWDDDMFLVNLLLPVVGFIVIVKLYSWIKQA